MKNEYAPFYRPYILTASKSNKGIIENLQDSPDLFSGREQLFAYAENKWTIKEKI